MDKLAFCRQHLHELSFHEIQQVYHLLSSEYDDSSIILSKSNDSFIQDFINGVKEYNLVDDLIGKMYDAPNEFCLYDKYVVLGDDGVWSFNDLDYVQEFIYKKLDGEAVEMILGFLEKG